MSGSESSARVSNLLASLQTVTNVSTAAFEGKAVSRSEKSLHLATTTGLIAIPVDEIEDVKPIQGSAQLVAVFVKDRTRVQHLLKVQLLDGAKTDEASAHREIGVGPGSPSCGSTTQSEAGDTVTRTSVEGADATDDVIYRVTCDDIWV